ncbi:countin-1-like isoform X1 [Mizuhopecten yessoensis]|uniref:countin-1-like isoform X1 n=1 Tax=Mizuhopecten yessoensis TaxID=6573 RepID=UPI000B45F042|nr:countin-1-like isoform X1 [Mizuhopecten yessoensis]
MKQSFALLAVVALLSQTFALPFVGSVNQKQHYITQLVQVPDRGNLGVDLCPTCIQFTDQAIDVLLNIILNSGVVGTCGTLCSALATKTGSQALGAVCNILCDVVGIEEFVKLLQKADLDPIYFCELLKTCAINDNGDAKITTFSVSPSSGPQGTFRIDFGYTSMNGTGTGEIVLEVMTVDGIPVESGFIHELAQAGNYTSSFSLKAQPDPNCDPSQGPCEQWIPGDYDVKIAICNGECGSKHPHSQTYDEGMTNFTITN